MTPRLGHPTPGFVVRSFEAARAYYCDRLGCRLTSWGGGGFEPGERPPTAGTVERGAFTLHLQEPSPATPAERIGKGGLQVMVEGLQSLHDHWRSSDVPIDWVMTSGPVDAQERPIAEEAVLSAFALSDPDGNRLEFWSEDAASPMPPLRSAIPVLRAGDYPRARAFWVEKLGFEVTEEGGDPPRFGIFQRERAEVIIDAWHGADPPREAGWRAYFHVDDCDATAEALGAAGVAIKRGPETMPYGLREIDVEDPDGNCLCFGQILDDTS